MPKTVTKCGEDTKELTNKEADAILKKLAPNWVEHLRDNEVLRRVMHGIIYARPRKK